jgi:hypothetical protein
MSIPSRRIRSAGCVRAASGYAAAPPSVGYELSPPYVDCHVILPVGVACSEEDLTTLQLDFMKNLLPAFSLDFTASR